MASDTPSSGESRVIYKYDIEVRSTGEAMFSAPVGAVLVSIAFQGEILRAWAIVDPRVGMHQRHDLFLAATGAELPRGVKPLPFCRVDRRGMVFHVFEVGHD